MPESRLSCFALAGAVLILAAVLTACAGSRASGPLDTARPLALDPVTHPDDAWTMDVPRGFSAEDRGQGVWRFTDNEGSTLLVMDWPEHATVEHGFDLARGMVSDSLRDMRPCRPETRARATGREARFAVYLGTRGSGDEAEVAVALVAAVARPGVAPVLVVGVFPEQAWFDHSRDFLAALGSVRIPGEEAGDLVPLEGEADFAASRLRMTVPPGFSRPASSMPMEIARFVDAGTRTSVLVFCRDDSAASMEALYRAAERKARTLMPDARPVAAQVVRARGGDILMAQWRGTQTVHGVRGEYCATVAIREVPGCRLELSANGPAGSCSLSRMRLLEMARSARSGEAEPMDMARIP